MVLLYYYYMGNQLNPKIIGATFAGLVLVGGAYLATSFGGPDVQLQTASSQNAVTAIERVPIEVFDQDNNGLEDWRDTFVNNEPIILERTAADFTLPDTITSRASIQLLEGLVNSKIYAPVAPGKEKIVADTVNMVTNDIEVKIYRTSELSIMSDWDIQDVVNYGNTVAATIYRHNLPEAIDEVDLLDDILRSESPERMVELKAIAEMYKAYAEDTILIPVPDILAKEHLDLINSYQAIYEDIYGMTTSFSDPVRALAHSKRYLNSTQGLRLSLENMMYGLEPYARDFDVNDPALLFVLFSPDYQPNF